MFLRKSIPMLARGPNPRFPFGKTSLAVRRTRPGYATSPVEGSLLTLDESLESSLYARTL
jgi:hypothetical protein